jgi:hypothetical protein
MQNNCAVCEKTDNTNKYINPLPSLMLQSARDLNVPCRPKRSKALLLSYTFKWPLKKMQSFCPCSRALNRSSKGLKHRNACCADKTQDMDGAKLYKFILILAWNLVIQGYSYVQKMAQSLLQILTWITRLYTNDLNGKSRMKEWYIAVPSILCSKLQNTPPLSPASTHVSLGLKVMSEV